MSIPLSKQFSALKVVQKKVVLFQSSILAYNIVLWTVLASGNQQLIR
ncbi:MAG: hypothetical protein Q9N67_05330 [Ghiorsea sp.]|nr:hypothetical protein [Ghiorsea sp.]